MKRRWRCICMAASLLVATAVPASELSFSVSLDGKPIGEHHFQLSGGEDARTVVSEANFNVKLLGLTVYRYQHKATEHWRGDCLRTLTAQTDDDGEPSHVQALLRGHALEVTSEAGKQSLPGCAMSFAYWNPAIRPQSHLLNAQTGKYESVQISRAGSAAIEVRGKSMTAERWRIDGPEQPIEVWTLPTGEWVGLDSTVRGGRKLSYRLR